MPSKKRDVNVLNANGIWKVQQQALKDWAFIEEKRPLKAEYCEFLTKELGFEVRPSNLITAITAMGRQWPWSKREPPGRTTGKQTDRTRYVAMCLRYLYEALNEEVPVPLKAMASGKYAIFQENLKQSMDEFTEKFGDDDEYDSELE